MHDVNQKITSDHLKRKAFLYVRQSTLRQVVENTESTKRQYALKQRALTLGWSQENIIVIDNDLGESGANSDREGFQHLVAEVGMGNAGIVMGLEVSRLARNCTDWHRLLEICALTSTLILDEEGLYDPSHFNDRLLLGLKGTMSEAELHLIRARLHGGLMNKARRGELRLKLPIGYVYDANNKIMFDPDLQVQEAVRQLFSCFKATGSAFLTVKAFKEKKIKFPRKILHGPRKGEIIWGELEHSRTLQTLHNPIYTGAYVYGRRKSIKNLDGKAKIRNLAQNEWQVVIQDNHLGYITWEKFQSNERQLLNNAQAYGHDRSNSPTREGHALLQGIVVCGQCGKRMTIRYKSSKGKTIPYYMCQGDGIKHAVQACQAIPGGDIDETIENILLKTVSAMNIEVALAVEKELQSQVDTVNKIRKQQIERAKYETEIARERYMFVNPKNRLVAESLEVEWNEKLRLYTEAQDDYVRSKNEERFKLSEQKKEEIRALVNTFPNVWKNEKTPQRERKRLLRLIIEDVTLAKEKKIIVNIRFQGGRTQSIELAKPKSAGEMRKTDNRVIDAIDKLVDAYTDGEIAEKLNENGMRAGNGGVLNSIIVRNIKRDYGIKSRYARLREKDMLTAKELAEKLDVSIATIGTWRRAGLLKCEKLNDKGEHMYEAIDYQMSGKSTWKMQNKNGTIKSLTATN